MANTFKIIPNRGVNFLRSPGVVHLTLTCGASYATASGGLAVDLTGVIQNIGPNVNATLATSGIPAADIVGGFGYSTLGWLAVLGPPVAGAPATFTMRLWNGTTEKGDGAITDVVELWVFTN